MRLKGTIYTTNLVNCYQTPTLPEPESLCSHYQYVKRMGNEKISYHDWYAIATLKTISSRKLYFDVAHYNENLSWQ